MPFSVVRSLCRGDGVLVGVRLPHQHATVPLTPSTRHAIDATHFEEVTLLARVEREAHARIVVAQREQVVPVVEGLW